MEDDARFSIKRKDFDRVNDEFSDFSLSSPARKIRRLDVDLPPIMEEEETDMPMPMMHEIAAEEEIDHPAPVNEERAIVLFKPLNYQSPSSGSIFVDRDLISGLKNRFFREAAKTDDKLNEDEANNKCQAVVCWNPIQSSYSQPLGTFQPPRTLEITELDESGEDAVMDDAAMEIEEHNKSSSPLFAQQAPHQLQQGSPSFGFGLHQWQQQQQNCMIPQLPQVSKTPITWFQ